MKDVTVNKTELLAVLDENRAAHRSLFERALDAYQEQAIQLLEDHIERIRHGKVEQVYVLLPKPEDHTSDYDRVIRMVQMSVDDKITLTQIEFAAYVQDDWDWKQQFLHTTSTYLSP